MVFQNFALLPWLTVAANVQVGLEARNVPPASGSSKLRQDPDVRFELLQDHYIQRRGLRLPAGGEPA